LDVQSKQTQASKAEVWCEHIIQEQKKASAVLLSFCLQLGTVLCVRSPASEAVQMKKIAMTHRLL